MQSTDLSFRTKRTQSDLAAEYLADFFGLPIPRTPLQKLARSIKLALCGIGAVLALCSSVFLIMICAFSCDSSYSVSETRVLTRNELRSLNRYDPSIRVLAGFEASEYGGWHGDGGSIEIYLFEPSRTERLISQLKIIHSDWEWFETSRPDFNFLEDHIPERFRPKPGGFEIGRDRHSSQKIVVGKDNGYVSFATSRF